MHSNIANSIFKMLQKQTTPDNKTLSVSKDILENSRKYYTGTGTDTYISKNVINTNYAVRGALAIKAAKYDAELKKGKKFPFQRITYCNIGNPQDLGQKPISFFRSTLSLIESPNMISMNLKLPDDVVNRASKYLENIKNSGAYTGSNGLEIIRKEVSNFISRRDGYPQDENFNSPNESDYYSHYENVFLGNGASGSITQTLQMFIENSSDGILIPIPQYPLYSATVTLLGGSMVPYYLDEKNSWGLDIKELEISINSAKKDNKKIRAIVIINPGNPTGQVLSKNNIQKIIDFCHANNISILADEVYQENVYSENNRFVSFKKVKREMGKKYERLKLFSFHSVSKGFIGECGKRGGYVEMDGIDENFKSNYYKLSSVSLCSNVVGQLMVGLMVNPPKKGDPSYETYIKEKADILDSLKTRSKIVVDTINSLPGIRCNSADGAMYVFPSLFLSEKFIDKARKLSLLPDEYYCNLLLDETGICTVPGSGFGQLPGTYHFRSTFLPREDHIFEMLENFKGFHQRLYEENKPDSQI